MVKLFLKKHKGSLTVEAALVFPLVIITLLFIANILNICMVHTCMQQSLNNTAKKISQDSYLVYRFAGEENYEKFINFLSKTNEGYETFKSKAEDTSEKLSKMQESSIDTITSFNTAKDTFKSYEAPKKILEIPKKIVELVDYCNQFVDNVKNLLDKCKLTIEAAKNFASSINALAITGKENISSIAIKLLLDASSGFAGSSVAEKLFNKYTKELKVPASRITDINFLHSSLNKDGSFTMVVSFKYVNPFSFVNSNIRMTNAITIKPFVGKNGTSIIGKNNTSEDGKSETLVWIPNSAYDVDVEDRKYHSRPDCGTMTIANATQVKLSDAKNSSKISGACQKCFPDGEPTE